ncbi:glycosyltransferase family protein [Cohnella caldifontis]|uniref:glycosyltransferase family protein n=1 Tax=Cohnella caldifontis TaxID=3027471 RepID=UPI0023EC3619|nr:glycosyltransferase family protein [Cohnella sp. YIM B05605]
MKIVLIIQARMGSTRLPGKVLFPLGDTVVLDYDVSRCRKDPRIADVIVATSTLEQDNPIADWCGHRGVTCYRGSEDDVLARYYDCARAYEPDYVIRVTSDCPFIDHEIISGIIDTMERSPCDVVIADGELPRGLWSEIVSFSALSYMYANGRESRHREHVTYYAYEFPERFRSVTYSVPIEMRHPHLRITLDTPEDYQMLKRVASRFSGDIEVSSKRVVSYLLDHPEVARINAHIQQKPVQ